MHIDSAAELLKILIENSARILRVGFGVGAAEATFFDAIRLVREHPELKKTLLDDIEATLKHSDQGLLSELAVPTEFIEFAAHEFRWDEFKELSESRVRNIFGGDPTMAVGDVSGHILDALSDGWADREFYRRYKNG